MRTALFICAALGLSILGDEPSSAKTVTLQTVDLNDREMSTEGGVATLYRVTAARGVYCRIEAIHYGETGKAILGFAFNQRLFSAVMREYRYDPPDFAAPHLRVRLADTQTLQTKEGSAHLPAAFKEYRSFFDAQKLAACARR